MQPGDGRGALGRGHIGGGEETSQLVVVGLELARRVQLGTVIDRLATLDGLRPGLSSSRALDIVRVINTTEAYIDLTMRRGWPPDEWSAWLLEVLTQQLLGSPNGD